MNEEPFTNKMNRRIQHLDKILNRPSLVLGYFTHNLLTDHKRGKLKVNSKFILDNFTQKDLEAPIIKFHVHSSNNAVFKGCLEGDIKTTIRSDHGSWIKDKGQENQIILKSFQENTLLSRNRRLIIDHILIELPINNPHHLSLSAYVDFGDENSRYNKHSLNSIEVNSMEIA
ncbi:hypothetical protein MUO14_21470 [Halobacillus shinanisalinarum]|uniref:Uncharacterized protein n=1 Tax=Halobacillus shinanisalinarum TaxID=2932258 RepID=A0ABY4GYJ0_9BACI|nr:hypothetical protein [Halobacillus shinanisalinarum]UOQ92939.1 hypothetical protein MUO14_21470 [Halobacillus shinanisalinarum]